MNNRTQNPTLLPQYIQEQTLRDVLVDALPRTPRGQQDSAAVELANAVKAGFEALRTKDASQS